LNPPKSNNSSIVRRTGILSDELSIRDKEIEEFIAFGGDQKEGEDLPLAIGDEAIPIVFREPILESPSPLYIRL
jgi:hypothetical protein